MILIAFGPTREAAITTAPAALEDSMKLVDDVSETFIGKVLDDRFYRLENLSPYTLLYRLASKGPSGASKGHRLPSGGDLVFRVQGPCQSDRVIFWVWHTAGIGVLASALVTEMG